MFKIIGICIILFLIYCIYDSASMSYQRSEYARKNKEFHEKQAAEARALYPKIENWSEHPLYKSACSFLVQKLDYFIALAKETMVGRDGGFNIKVEVNTRSIYISAYFENYNFYYSDDGYDNIKVGYTDQETEEACRDFASALELYLKEYYSSRETINFSCLYPPAYFHIDLSQLHPKLKKV